MSLINKECPSMKTVSFDIDLVTAQKEFSLDGWEELQQQFDIYNAEFFNGMLPKVLIISGYHSTAVGGLCFNNIIFISRDDPFVMNCALLHEMLHLSNKIEKVFDFNHGIGWIEAMLPIHKVLNIDIDIYKFTNDEAHGWPYTMFKNYGLKAYFKKCFMEHRGFKPLPSGWNLERSPPAGNQTDKTLICKGDPAEDLKALEETFGVEYIENLTRRYYQ